MTGFVVPLVPHLVVVGYLVSVLRASANGELAPAFMENPRRLARESGGATALIVVFLLVPVLALLVTVYGLIYGGGEVDAGGSPVLVFGGSTVVLSLCLIGTYLFPLALTGYARHGSLRMAFDGGWLRRAGGRVDYLGAWTLAVVLVTLGIGLAISLFSVTSLGPVIAALVLAYVSIVSSHLLGRSLADVR